MSQALKIPTEINLSDVGIDRVCKIIRADLANLSWLELTSLGRIYPQVDEEGNIEPWIHKEGKDYYPAYPNDTLDTFSALYPHDDEKVMGFGYLGQRTLSVIVWLNLERLQQSTPSIEKFKDEIVIRLRELACVSEVHHTFDQSKSPGVYPGFSLKGLMDQYNTYPYRAFRIETTVNYFIDCV
ncbi:hypothetical protein GCM10027347_52550 [Larkinella harenae]